MPAALQRSSRARRVPRRPSDHVPAPRSEEHTSELQSLSLHDASSDLTSLRELVDAPGVLTAEAHPRSLSPRSGLYFVGFRESVRGQLYEAGRDARRVAAELARA